VALNKAGGGACGSRAEAEEPAALLLLPRRLGPRHLGAAGHRGPASSAPSLPGHAGPAGKAYGSRYAEQQRKGIFGPGWVHRRGGWEAPAVPVVNERCL